MSTSNTNQEKSINYQNYKSDWNNSDNVSFYEEMSMEYFMYGVTQTGLSNGCDIDAIQKHINKASSLLEIGAGYGRVLEHVIKRGFDGELFAVERNSKMYQHIKKEYGNKAKIINTDIRQMKIDKQFDLILWMWTGIAEFSKPEQPSIIKILASHLSPNGLIAIDVVPIECSTANTADIDKHNRIIIAPHGTESCYLPSSGEIDSYAKELGLSQGQTIAYETSTKKQRNIHIIQKSSISQNC